MEAKHTPGPWEVTTGAFEIAERINGKPAVDIAYHVIAEHQTGMQAHANARLIASAPCLMEALNCSAHTLRAIEKHLTGNQLAMVKVQIAACESLIERATK